MPPLPAPGAGAGYPGGRVKNEYRTIPIHVQYLKGSYGTVDLGATMALILMSIIPVIVFYLTCQKHIIKGVAAGAVKG